MKKRNERKTTPSRLRGCLIMISIALLGFGAGCEDDVVSQPQKGAPNKEQAKRPEKAGAAGAQPAAGATGQRATVQSGGVEWRASRNWDRRAVEGRDPFFGFVDELIAEKERQAELAAQEEVVEEEVLLPAQRFDVRDFRLVAIVTNTAEPKALLLDSRNGPHTLKRGDLIGNKNGVIVDIRRNEIEILQGEDVINAPERVVMKLHPDASSNISIEMR